MNQKIKTAMKTTFFVSIILFTLWCALVDHKIPGLSRLGGPAWGWGLNILVALIFFSYLEYGIVAVLSIAAVEALNANYASIELYAKILCIQLALLGAYLLLAKRFPENKAIKYLRDAK